MDKRIEEIQNVAGPGPGKQRFEEVMADRIADDHGQNRNQQKPPVLLLAHQNQRSQKQDNRQKVDLYEHYPNRPISQSRGLQMLFNPVEYGNIKIHRCLPWCQEKIISPFRIYKPEHSSPAAPIRQRRFYK